MKYLLVIAIVFAVNLMPVFGPPTWLLLVFARLRWNMNPVLLVACGGPAAASGRYVLAVVSKRLVKHFPERLRRNLAAAQSALKQRRGGAMVTLGLFVVSPLPSAQLFVAAGMLEMNLVVLTLAFFAGRILSYSFYMSVATIAQQHIGDVLTQVWKSPWSIVVELTFVALVAVLPFIHWKAGDDQPVTEVTTTQS